MNIEYQGVKIELVQGNIAAQFDIQAIVNAANAQLRKGGGVAGAIHRAAGPGLEKEAVPLGPIAPGQAVITGGHNLPNQFVIHCLGPVYGVNHPEAELLADCYRHALKLADRYEIESVAFPAISTGIFGYPVKEAARVAMDAIITCIPDLQFVTKIRFVLYDAKTLQVHEEMLKTRIRIR